MCADGTTFLAPTKLGSISKPISKVPNAPSSAANQTSPPAHSDIIMDRPALPPLQPSVADQVIDGIEAQHGADSALTPDSAAETLATQQMNPRLANMANATQQSQTMFD
jgi:hypothetical protein